jgi:membrane protein DedA with SNARE-associated domain
VLGRRLLTVEWLARRVDTAALEHLGARLDARLVPVVLGSRFLPGSRLPIFVAAGIFGRRPIAFAAWSLLAVLLWTPMLVLLTAWFGPALTNPLVAELGYVCRFVAISGTLTLALRLVVRRLAQRTS